MLSRTHASVATSPALGLCGRRGGEIRRHCQEAARSNHGSNRRASPGSVPVTSQWCAQEADDQAARTYTMASWSPTWSRTIMKVCSMLLVAVRAPRV